MNTFERYGIHFGAIGGTVFVLIILLMILDGGELLIPVLVLTILFSDLLFVFFMTLLFSIMAKPVVMNISINDKEKFMEAVDNVSKKKWGRVQRCCEEGKSYRYVFTSKYKDWLTTDVTVKIEDDRCQIVVPNLYQEDIIKIIQNG